MMKLLTNRISSEGGIFMGSLPTDIQSKFILLILFVTIIKISTNNIAKLLMPGYDIQKNKVKVAFLLTAVGVVVLDIRVLNIIGLYKKPVTSWMIYYDYVLTSLFLTSGTRAIHKLNEAWDTHVGQDNALKKSEKASKTLQEAAGKVDIATKELEESKNKRDNANTIYQADTANVENKKNFDKADDEYKKAATKFDTAKKSLDLAKNAKEVADSALK